MCVCVGPNAEIGDLISSKNYVCYRLCRVYFLFFKQKFLINTAPWVCLHNWGKGAESREQWEHLGIISYLPSPKAPQSVGYVWNPWERRTLNCTAVEPAVCSSFSSYSSPSYKCLYRVICYPQKSVCEHFYTLMLVVWGGSGECSF